MILLKRNEELTVDEITRKITVRLVASTLAVIISVGLSGVAFYYFHAKAPIIPLIVALIGSPAAAIMLMSLHDLRLLKINEAQQSHKPPQRTGQ